MRFFKQHSSPPSPLRSTSNSSSATESIPTSQENILHHSNTSTSNLSTSSTLLDQPAEAQPQSLARQTSENERRTQTSQAWPRDPYRGGFGGQKQEEVIIGGRRISAKEERREARREVKEWLIGKRSC